MGKWTKPVFLILVGTTVMSFDNKKVYQELQFYHNNYIAHWFLDTAILTSCHSSYLFIWV